ncbi:WD repeat-containing protein 43 [Rhizophlyctis rosea]|uniref:WD repeat-containing protein 43 n=1 Tax=Rhizophlyctis rosea TaxID=64517 RepID=A0AAD5S5Q5_9FUNG|nr:WD repeat-containing protein 43 [Rhizophlyctis rosea]
MGKRKSGAFSAAAVKTTIATQDKLQTTSFLLSAFDTPACTQFAAVSQAVDSHRLRVWDTRTSALTTDFAAPVGHGCTCLSWGFVGDAVDTTEGKKKKRRRASHTPSAQYIALGLNSGEISLFSVAQGQVSRTLTGGHTASVNDFSFSADGVRGFSGGEDGFVVEWDLRTGAELSKWKADVKAVKKVRLSNDGQRIVTASHQIKLWDTASKALLKTFAGHATPVIRLEFSEDSKTCVSAADQDRFLSVWDCSDNGPSTNISALTLDAPPTQISLSSLNHLLALTQDGLVHIFQSPTSTATGEPAPKKKKYVARPPDALLRVKEEGGDDVQPILAATFVDGKVLIGRGHIVKPTFERVDYLDERDKVLPVVELTRGAATATLVDDSTLAEQSLKASTKSYTPNDAIVVSADDAALPSVPYNPDEPTIEDRLTAMALTPQRTTQNAPETPGKAGKRARPTASSLHNMLVQAVHSSDKDLMEQALRVRDPNIIMQTVKRLPSTVVVPFLDEILQRLEKAPTRAADLLEWMRAVLLVHSAYLISVPHLVTQLGALYRTLDSRCQVFPKLLRLAGRLDLVMSQIKMRDRSKDGAEEEQAMAVYDEEEDLSDDGEDMSDEEMMDAMDVEEFDEEDVSENESDDEDVDDDEEEGDGAEEREGSDADEDDDMDEDL